MQRLAVHRVESCPRAYGGNARSLPMVQCRRSLRNRSARFGTRYRSVEPAMEFHNLETVLIGTGSRSRRGSDPAMHAYRSSARTEEFVKSLEKTVGRVLA